MKDLAELAFFEGTDVSLLFTSSLKYILLFCFIQTYKSDIIEELIIQIFGAH